MANYGNGEQIKTTGGRSEREGNMTLKAQQQGHVLRELFCPQTESMAAIWI
jgi:hypothetical protein